MKSEKYNIIMGLLYRKYPDWAQEIENVVRYYEMELHQYTSHPEGTQTWTQLRVANTSLQIDNMELRLENSALKSSAQRLCDKPGATAGGGTVASGGTTKETGKAPIPEDAACPQAKFGPQGSKTP